MSTDPFDLGAEDGREMGPPDDGITRPIARTLGTDLKHGDEQEKNRAEEKEGAA